MSEIKEEEVVFILDGDKGFGFADDALRDKVIRAACTKFFRTLKSLFWRICRANSKARFESLIDKLRQINELAAQYLLDALPELWAKAYFVRTRFGHDTSNVVESINKVLKLDRQLLTFQLLASL